MLTILRGNVGLVSPHVQSIENAVPGAPEKLTSLAITAVEKPNIQ